MVKEKESILEKIEEAVAETAKKVVSTAEKVAEGIVEDAKQVIEVSKEKKKKTARADSESEEKKAKLAKLKEKAKALEQAVEGEEVHDLKKRVIGVVEEKKDMLVPIEDYLKSSIHLGTRVITPDMKSFVYKRRADGLAVFNTNILDDKIKEGAEYLSKFDNKDIIIVCKREAGWKAVDLFSKITGVRAFTKKYPAGILTNPKLDNFTETELVFICDPWLDKNALADALNIKIPVLSICDTNNYTQGITKIIPGNNKSAKSLGMILYLLAKIYVKNRKLNAEIPPIEEFVEGWDNLQPPK